MDSVKGLLTEILNADPLDTVTVANLAARLVLAERDRIIRLIEDEQAFLTAGDKMMLRELIHDSAEAKPAVESCAACGGPLTKWPGGAMACETCHRKATLL